MARRYFSIPTRRWPAYPCPACHRQLDCFDDPLHCNDCGYTESGKDNYLREQRTAEFLQEGIQKLDRDSEGIRGRPLTATEKFLMAEVGNFFLQADVATDPVSVLDLLERDGSE